MAEDAGSQSNQDEKEASLGVSDASQDVAGDAAKKKRRRRRRKSKKTEVFGSETDSKSDLKSSDLKSVETEKDIPVFEDEEVGEKKPAKKSHEEKVNHVKKEEHVKKENHLKKENHVHKESYAKKEPEPVPSSDFSFNDEEVEKESEKVVQKEESVVAEESFEPVTGPVAEPAKVENVPEMKSEPAFSQEPEHASIFGEPIKPTAFDSFAEPFGSTPFTAEPVPSAVPEVSKSFEEASKPVEPTIETYQPPTDDSWGSPHDAFLGATPGVAAVAAASGSDEASFFGHQEPTKDVESKKVEDKETDELPKPNVSEFGWDQTKEPARKEVSFDGTNSNIKEDFPQNESTDYYSKPQVVVADVTEKSPVGPDEMKEKSDFLRMLEEAGVKMKHIYIALSILVGVVAIILFMVFGGYKIFTSGQGTSVSEGTAVDQETDVDTRTSQDVTVSEDTSKDTETAKDTNTTTSQSTTEINSAVTDLQQNFALSGIISSYIFGLEFSQNAVLPLLDLAPVTRDGSMIGVDSAIAAGQPIDVKKDDLVVYVDLLRQIGNARSIDLYAFLNRTTDRVSALGGHIQDLQILLNNAEADKVTITSQLNQLNLAYQNSSKQKAAYEKSFFGSMNQYYGSDAYSYLELFVESNQTMVQVKAHYNALKTLSEMFDREIALLKPRIDDIIKNTDALIKGVKVTTVPGSNINTIINPSKK